MEQRLAELEGGIASVATASGTSAISTTLLILLKSGDHIVASNSLYGGTYNMLKNTLPRLGITTTFVDPDDPDNLDMPFWVTAHEMGHQWWPHQVSGGSVKGANFMSEGLSEYSAVSLSLIHI